MTAVWTPKRPLAITVQDRLPVLILSVWPQKQGSRIARLLSLLAAPWRPTFLQPSPLRCHSTAHVGRTSQPSSRRRPSSPPARPAVLPSPISRQPRNSPSSPSLSLPPFCFFHGRALLAGSPNSTQEHQEDPTAAASLPSQEDQRPCSTEHGLRCALA
jgi:hypothetical protein